MKRVAKRLVIIITRTSMFLLAIFTLLLLYFNPFAKPDPHEYAQWISGLQLPKEMKLIQFHNKTYEMLPDRNTIVKYSIHDSDIQKITSECKRRDYLPIKGNWINDISSLADSTDKGYYELNHYNSSDERDYRMSVFNITRKKLHVEINIF